MERRDRRHERQHGPNHEHDQEQEQEHWGNRSSTNTSNKSRSRTGVESKGSGDVHRPPSSHGHYWGAALRTMREELQPYAHAHHSSSNQYGHSSDGDDDDGWSQDLRSTGAFGLALEQTREFAAATALPPQLAVQDMETVPDDASRVSKSSLSFILDDEDIDDLAGLDDSNNLSQSSAPSSVVSDSDYEAPATVRECRGQRGSAADAPAAPGTDAPTRSAHAHTSIRPETTAAASAKGAARRNRQGDSKHRARRPPSRICKFDGCEQYVVDQGLCVRHGGGKRCQTEGCTSRAKHQGRCWRHGGSTECKVPSCMNRAKSRGYCWSHGGGTKCKADTCEKIAISNGLCWAHGGGKRCIVKGCKRQAYERTNNYCNNHFQELESGTFMGDIEDDDESSSNNAENAPMASMKRERAQEHEEEQKDER